MGDISDKADVECGVPQGSIICLLLFVIYITDKCKVVLYVDATVLMFCHSGVNTIQQQSDRENVSNKKLHVNINKTVFFVTHVFPHNTV